MRRIPGGMQRKTTRLDSKKSNRVSGRFGSRALPHKSSCAAIRGAGLHFSPISGCALAKLEPWRSTKAAVDAAQERTKAYLPQIQAALDKLKSQSEKPPPLIADAELYTGKVRDVYKPNKFPQHVVLAATGGSRPSTARWRPCPSRAPS